MKYAFCLSYCSAEVIVPRIDDLFSKFYVQIEQFKNMLYTRSFEIEQFKIEQK